MLNVTESEYWRIDGASSVWVPAFAGTTCVLQLLRQGNRHIH
jgi:hypothetical protein